MYKRRSPPQLGSMFGGNARHFIVSASTAKDFWSSITSRDPTEASTSKRQTRLYVTFKGVH